MGVNSLEEQEICISCGFCCDRTLFDVARLTASDELWGKLVDRETEIDGKRFMRLPCPYFDSKCTIYDKNKPAVCSSFKCKVLKDSINGVFTKQEALDIIKEAKKTRDELVKEYRLLKGPEKTFREIFVDAHKNPEFEKNKELRLIKMKADLLDILLTKYFKPEDAFKEFYELID